MKIESGSEYFWQWERRQKIEVPENCVELHIANGTTDKALVLDVFEENGKRLVKVPDELLRVAAQLRCYAWNGASVIETESFDVLPREEPDDYVYEPEEVRRYEKLEAELRQCIKEQAALQSQGRSANYDFHSGGWKRILNFIRSSSGHLNLCVVTPGIYRLTHILSLDITGFVKYAQDTSNEGKPVIIKRYENIFGEDDAMQKHPVKITKIRVGYPKAGTDFPEADGTIDYGANPVNCYVDVYVEFDGTDLSGPYAAFNMNFAGFAENHNCEAVTEETDAPSTGYYGEELEYYEVAVKDIPFYLTKDNIGGGYGLKVNTNGYVGMEVATEKQIDAAKAKYLAITPTNVQYAIDLYTKEIKKKAEVAAVVDDANVGADAWSSKNIVDKLCPAFAESGSVVVCEPVEGYPLRVSTKLLTSTGVSKITLYHEGLDGEGDEVSTEYTVDFGETYFDGYYDWETGELHTTEEGTMQFAPQVITAFYGRNSFRSDCGDTFVSGKADPNDCWGKKLAEQKVDDTKVGTAPWSSKNTVDKLCPSFTESGGVAVCEPVEGYPLEVVSTIVDKGSTWRSITLKQCGKNLFDFKQPVSYVTYVSSSGQGSRYGYWFVLPAGTYTMHAEPIGEVKDQYIYCALNDFNGNQMTVDGFSFLKQGTKYWTRTFTLPESARVYIYNGLSKTSGGDENSSNLLFQTHNIQIEAGSVATAYEPYRNGGQWTVNFANLDTSENGEFSFGSYNWQTGVLDTEENGMYQHDPETDTFTYIENGNYVPPIVRNMPAMPGTNCFYSDCGNTTIKGKADPTKIIDKLTNAILALGGNV